MITVVEKLSVAFAIDDFHTHRRSRHRLIGSRLEREVKRCRVSGRITVTMSGGERTTTSAKRVFANAARAEAI